MTELEQLLALSHLLDYSEREDEAQRIFLARIAKERERLEAVRLHDAAELAHAA